ncbi:DNA-deoxyinosine glycosylase [Sphingomonas sp. MMS24-J13]|uniref:DNA-deoxyinosine glycosylase n=1 Tax=Sphingomonas sp. MMS24-J13 TaxID=3238686 RepID=UPI003850DB13
MSSQALKAAFPASVDANTRLLVLGSLPGEVSLAARQYYANPTNQFWRLLGGVIGEDLPMLGYSARLDRLLAHGIGLWDVIQSARRAGSLDTAIRDHQPRDLRAFAMHLPNLRAIAFNGGKAASIGRRQWGVDDGSIALLDLPSSSAAHCSISFDAKQAQWLALKSHAGSFR